MLREPRHAGGADGFTLVELLVVILILGVLAAVAIPSFLSQRAKAYDANAKTYTRTAATAEETWFTDNRGYTDTLADLETIEPTLHDTPSAALPAIAPGAAVGDTAANSYSISVRSGGSSDVMYVYTRHADGTVERTCSPSNSAGCNASGVW